MVLKGQFLERPALVRVDHLVLEGLAHRGSTAPPLLILSPLPDEGGGMDHVAGAEIAWAAATSGHATLRFNYRGVGSSQGKVSPQTHSADARAAIELLRESAGGATPAIVSIGGSAGLLADLVTDEVAGAAAVAPPRIEVEELQRWGTHSLVIVPERDIRVPRASLSLALSKLGGHLEIIPGADIHFAKNLVQVGRSVADWLEALWK